MNHFFIFYTINEYVISISALKTYSNGYYYTIIFLFCQIKSLGELINSPRFLFDKLDSAHFFDVSDNCIQHRRFHLKEESSHFLSLHSHEVEFNLTDEISRNVTGDSLRQHSFTNLVYPNSRHSICHLSKNFDIP